MYDHSRQVDPTDTVRIIFTDATIPGTYAIVTDATRAALLACDRVNVVDDTGRWHSADVVRRIIDTSDGLLTIVVAD